MSDLEDAGTPAEHPSFGGKSLAALERPRYKSWRKKYRKMRQRFDNSVEDNKRYFREEQKLEGIARRLREELDTILEICLDLNDNAALPTDLRFNISRPGEAHTTGAQLQRQVPEDDVPANITPEQANDVIMSYTNAVQQGRMPHVDLYIVRGRVEAALAAQGTTTLDELERSVPHPIITSMSELPQELQGDSAVGYFTTDLEDAYLTRLDAKLGDRPAMIRHRKNQDTADERQRLEYITRENERFNEVFNPQSPHNWLKAHGKSTAPDPEDTSAALVDSVSTPEPKSTNARKRNLAKQIADKAVDRAQRADGGGSPGYYDDDDDMSFIEEQQSTPQPSLSSRKKAKKDDDAPYRSKTKITPSGGGSVKGKRKRNNTEEGATAKKAKTEPVE